MIENTWGPPAILYVILNPSGTYKIGNSCGPFHKGTTNFDINGHYHFNTLLQFAATGTAPPPSPRWHTRIAFRLSNILYVLAMLTLVIMCMTVVICLQKRVHVWARCPPPTHTHTTCEIIESVWIITFDGPWYRHMLGAPNTCRTYLVIPETEQSCLWMTEPYPRAVCCGVYNVSAV